VTDDSFEHHCFALESLWLLLRGD